MRNRSDVKDTTYDSKVWVTMPDGFRLGLNPFSTFWSPWNDHPGFNRSFSAAISDELSISSQPRTYHNCTHVISEGAIFRKDYSYGHYGWSGLPRSYCSIDCSFSYAPNLPTTPSGLWNGLLDDLASLANGHTQNSAMLPVTLLEGVKTIAMMRNPFNLLKPNFRRKVGKLTASVLALKGSSVWLEGYYGWKSTYQDFQSIAKATAQFLNSDPSSYLEKLGRRLTASTKISTLVGASCYDVGTSNGTWDYFLGLPDDSFPSFPYGAIARRVRCSEEVRYTLGCRQFQAITSILQRTRAFLAAYGACDWRDIRDTLWEVVPFSFVIDWFVDTRGIWAPLNKMRLQEMDIKDIGYSTQCIGKYDVELFLGSPKPIPGYNYVNSCTDRTISSSSPGMYKLYFRTPGFPSDPAAVYSKFSSKGLSLIQMINGSALIVQQIFKPRK